MVFQTLFKHREKIKDTPSKFQKMTVMCKISYSNKFNSTVILNNCKMEHGKIVLVSIKFYFFKLNKMNDCKTKCIEKKKWLNNKDGDTFTSSETNKNVEMH